MATKSRTRKSPKRKAPDKGSARLRTRHLARVQALTDAFLDDVAYQIRVSRAESPRRIAISQLESLLKTVARSTQWNSDGQTTRRLSVKLAALVARIAVEGCHGGRFQGPTVPKYRDDDMEGG